VLRWTSPDWIWPRLWNFPLYGNPYVVSYCKFSSLVSSKYMLPNVSEGNGYISANLHMLIV
jgi:hypothetical protein